MDAEKLLLRMEHISKRFPAVVALDDVEFSLRAGEIHALLGENGAGKSTLIKVLTGVEQRDSGTVWLEGKEILPRTPAGGAGDRHQHGVSGGQPLPQPVGGGEPLSSAASPRRAQAHRLESHKPERAARAAGAGST